MNDRVVELSTNVVLNPFSTEQLHNYFLRAPSPPAVAQTLKKIVLYESL